MIRKSFEAVETKVLDPTQGLVECVFSVTGNRDRQNDIIEPGAFTKALAAKSSVSVVYAHVWDDINQVLGKTVTWKELFPGDPGLPPELQAKGFGGVKATVQFDQETPAGRVAFTHVKNKNIKDWSFAFDIDPDGEKFEDADNSRHIKSVAEMYEVTLALIGANPATTTMAFKSMVDAEAKQNVPGSYEDRAAKISSALSARCPADTYPWVVATFDDRVVYCTDYGSGDGFSVSYSFDASGAVTLGDPTPVRVTAVITPKAASVAASQTLEPIQAKSNDEAINRYVEAAILRDLSALTPSVPDYAKAPRDDEPDFESFLTYPQQGVITRG